MICLVPNRTDTANTNATGRAASKDAAMADGYEPSVAVVIPAYNAERYLGEQLAALWLQDAEWLQEVIVVDNVSTDKTRRVAENVAAEWPKIRIVNETRRNANASRNAGVRATHTSLVVLCDADDVIDVGWLRAMRDGLADFDLVRGRYDVERLNSAHWIAARGAMALVPSGGSGEPINGLGGSCGFHRSTWERLGGLAEHHYGSDDEEFFWRAHLEGLRVGYVPDGLIHYRLRPSYRDLFRQQRNWASNQAQLHREFGELGFIRRRSLGLALKSWAWLLANAVDSISDDAVKRGRWVRVAARNIGRLQGSIRHRCFFP